MEKPEYYFGFRFENMLKERIVQFSKTEPISLNKPVKKASTLTAQLHDQRKIQLNQLFSGFISRRSVQDKKYPSLLRT